MANRSPVSDRVLQAIVTIQRARRVAGEGARGGQGGIRGVESQQGQASQRSHGGGADGRVRGGGGSLKAVVAEVAGALEKREVEELMTELQRRHDWKATLEVTRRTLLGHRVFAWSQQQAWFRPNMRLYNALMGFLAREQQAHAATLLFQDMLLSRARPNHFTYTALINAYGRAGWFEDALAVFHHMKTCDDDDCRPNTVTCNALIGALCKGGMYDEAVEVFMDMRAGAGGAGGLPLNCRGDKGGGCACDGITNAAERGGKGPPARCQAPRKWTSAAHCNAAKSVWRSAYDIDDRARQGAEDAWAPVQQTSPRANEDRSMPACAERGMVSQAARQTRLACSPGETRQLVLARPCTALRPSWQRPNIVTYNTLIDTLPNIVTYNTLIDTLCREGQLDAALQVGMPLCRWVCRSAGGYAALQVGMPHDHGLLVWIRFAGVDTVCWCNTVLEEDLSSGVLDSQVAPNIVTFNTIINIVLEDLSSGVLDSQVAPNIVTFNTIINACGKAFETPYPTPLAPQVLEDLSSGVLDSQVAPNIVTFNTIINACDKAFETPYPTPLAPQVLEDLSSGVLDSQVAPNIVTFNTIINACGKAFETPYPTPLAPQVLEDLSSGVLDSQVAPNIVTFNTIINACGKAGRAPDAEATLHAMERTGMPPDGITFTALVDAYGRTGDVERAEEAFQRMLQAGISPDVFSYTALMAAFGRAGLSDRVTETLAAMQRAGVPPNEVTFLTVLDAHGKAGNYEEAEATLAVMVTCGYRPSVYSWSCLIDAFGKAGLYAKAAGAFERMQAEGCRPNLITYAAILSACARCDKWEGALELLYCLQRTGGEWEVAMCRLVMAGPEEEGVECASEEEMLEGLVRGGARGGAGRRGERADEGLWESAGRMFGAFQAVPLPMRRSFYNALADVLWSFGMRRRAARVVALGRGLGVYGGADDLHKEARGARRVGAGRRESSSSGSESESGSGSGSGSGKQRGGGGGSGRGGGMWREEGVWSVDLHEHSIGSACAFLYLWLRDLRTAWQWHNEIPEAIDIVTGWGRHSKRKDATSDKPAQVAPLKAAILRELHLMRSPFQELSVNAGRLVAGGWAAYSWLLQEEMGEQLQLRDAPQPVPPGDKPYQPL
ncbi:unnamed protein product [Closterium sp. NIES-64]|nr:unnamed protein product [Closterium sp. NIES-64]